MKKLLLFLLTFVATTVAATADEVSFDFKNNEYGLTRQTANDAPYIDNGTVCQNGAVTMTLFKASGKNGMRLWNDGLRFYKNSTAGFTLSVANGTINSVEITKAKKAIFTKEGTETEATETEAQSWTNINASEVKFNYSSGENAALLTVKVTYTPGTSGPELTTATLSFPEKEYSLTFGDEFTVPLLTVEPEAAKSLVHFSSSAPEVAEINAITGDITVKAVGTTTITATIDEDDTYYRASDSYKLTVREAPNNMYYTIIFKNTTGGDATSSPSATTDALIEEGANYISETETITLSKVYLGKKDFGLKFSSSNNNGSITLPLSELGQVYAHTIEVQAAQYGRDNSSLKVNGSAAQTIKGNDLATYTYTVSSDAPLTELKLEANKRLYVKQITVYRVPPMPAIDGMTDAGQNVDITPGETVLTVNVEKGCNLYVHEYFGESANAPQRISSAVKDIDLTSGAWRHLNADGSASVEYPVPAGVKEIHFVAEHKNHVSTPLSLIINEDGTATGIEDIEAAEAEGATEWYTLQGVRVSAPAAAGLYIRRTAGTVEKVLVK